MGVDGLYEYAILSQPLKQPTIVLARDRQQFEQKHSQDVLDFLNKYRFWGASGKPLLAVNASECTQSFYDSIAISTSLPRHSLL
jgi:hypothetical protein